MIDRRLVSFLVDLLESQKAEIGHWRRAAEAEQGTNAGYATALRRIARGEKGDTVAELRRLAGESLMGKRGPGTP